MYNDLYDLEPVLCDIFNKENKIYKTKTKNGHIIKIEYKNNVEIMCNANYHIIVDAVMKTRMTWEDVKALCDKLKLSFKNQSFGNLIKEVYAAFKKKDSVREYTTSSKKKAIMKEQHGKCNYCKCNLVFSQTQIDHIKRLIDGGDNSRENLQALCIPCHFAKTREYENSD